jgi:hypothetical protein
MQDDNPQLSRWFATRPDARYVFKRNIQMKKYKIGVAMSFWQTIEVEAESREDAEYAAFYQFDRDKATMGEGHVFHSEQLTKDTDES